LSETEETKLEKYSSVSLNYGLSVRVGVFRRFACRCAVHFVYKHHCTVSYKFIAGFTVLVCNV